MSAPPWSAADIPDQSGRRALVTGVTSGLGEQVVLELVRHGAEVLLGARNPAKLEATIARVLEAVPGARLHPVSIDVSDLASVRRGAAQAAEHGPLHLLVNNAGVMAVPHERTADGLDLQMATNHFGPFALTGLLMPRLVESGGARVVAVSSVTHRLVRRPPLDDPRDPHAQVGRYRTYGRSKLADLLFVLELDRRARALGVPVKGLAAHPGYASTGLMAGGVSILQGAFALLGQPAEKGALPVLMAATADLPGSSFVGPDGPLEMRGDPKVTTVGARARDPEAQRRLWEISQEATGVRFLEG